jgi:putative membrane-bound dehydrogenase-like protein
MAVAFMLAMAMTRVMTTAMTKTMARFMTRAAFGAVWSVLAFWGHSTIAVAEGDAPRSLDPRLTVTLFAAAPDIVHPISVDFDPAGRMLVVESHTHFRPAGYQGPATDRIRVIEDTDGDGRADRFTTFHEGLTHIMDLAVHRDGTVYVATRNAVWRLVDGNRDGVADDASRIVFLDTPGNYPHNGLSGLCFDHRGDLWFGMGENLGAVYKLIGGPQAASKANPTAATPGTTAAATPAAANTADAPAANTALMGEGDGGHVFWCRADGTGLRRVATGFWNPFGNCRDIFGRVFTIDNDPDSRPPCRMLHLQEGADYGFQFRYGRSGRHPFQAWNGELMGTLPMMTGVGESPCEMVSYESDGLPSEYLGELLVTAWADHRVERYTPRRRGASWGADRKPFIQGGKDFRPVGLAVAPDGSLFVSDWVLRDYNLHGRGALWHVRAKESSQPARPVQPARQAQPERPDEPLAALSSRHRPTRDAAARRLATDGVGRAALARQLQENSDIRVRASAVDALVAVDAVELDLAAFARSESNANLLEMAVAALAARGGDTRPFLSGGPDANAAVTVAAIGGLRTVVDRPRLMELLSHGDPFVAHAAMRQLAAHPDLLPSPPTAGANAPGANAPVDEPADSRQASGLLLAHRASGRIDSRRGLPAWLGSRHADVRLLAAKWVADERIVEARPAVAAALAQPQQNVTMLRALLTALGRIDDKAVNEGQLVGLLNAQVSDMRQPAALRALALQGIPARPQAISLDRIRQLLSQPDAEPQLEAARLLAEYSEPGRFALLSELARDAGRSEAVRATAIAGLADESPVRVVELLELARENSGALRREALRALSGAPLSAEQRTALDQLAAKDDTILDIVRRLRGESFRGPRPGPRDLDGWLRWLEGLADANAGRRLFAHTKLAGCVRCHRVEGRGAEIGPDLGRIGAVERRGLIESLVQPSTNVAPHFQTWAVETEDGRVRNGMIVHTQLDETTYVNEKGEPFKVLANELSAARPLPTSLMPENLLDAFTDQEVRDLFAYLTERR